MPRPKISSIKTAGQTFARFWSQVDIGEPWECWPYKGGKDPDGYGIFSAPIRKSVRAHRKAFAYAYGHPPNGMGCHTCHNRACCNPAHIYDGTGKTNSDDMYAAGRERSVYVPGERHRNAKLTDQQVAEIRHGLALGIKGKDLAARYGVTPQHITHIKNGRTRVRPCA